nr:GrpB family protein [Mycetocola reblochoni]
MAGASLPRRPDVTALELVGGPEPLTHRLHEDDGTRATLFRAHRDRIVSALGPSALTVEHIGSTSVPGLAAKPIIDIVVAVADVTAEEDYLTALIAAGYELRVREHGHRLVRTPERDVHVHLYADGDPAIAAYLTLRDHLRTDADDRALYAATKRVLMERDWADGNDYADAKGDVIAAIIARARARAAATES